MAVGAAARITAVIVEDDVNFRNVISEILRDDGVEVVTADTLARAYAVIDEMRPDVVVLDLVLPDGRGEDLLTDLAKLGRASPGVVLLSADTRRVVELAAVHGVPSLSKPLDFDIAAVTIRVAAEQKIRPWVATNRA